MSDDDDDNNAPSEDDDDASDDDTADDDDTGDDDDSSDTIPPYVVDSSPSDGEVELKLRTAVVIEFSEKMDQKTAEEAFQMTEGAKAEIEGTYSWNQAGGTLTFTPSVLLSEDTEYTVTLFPGALDVAGNPLNEKHEFTFITVDLWTITYNGESGGSDVGTALAVDDQQNIYATGWISTSGQGYDIWVRKYNSDSSEAWTDTYDGPIYSNDRGYGIVRNADGYLFVVGYENASSGNTDIWLCQYGTSGTPIGTPATHDGPAGTEDSGHALALDGAGRVYVAGGESVTGQGQNVWIGRYDGGSLNLWDTYNGASDGDDKANAIAIDSAGGIYVAGYETATGQDKNIWVRKYEPEQKDATPAWTVIYNGEADGEDYATGIALDEKNDFAVVVGRETTAMTGTDIWIGQYNMADGGDPSWVVTVDGEDSGIDSAEGVIADSEGNIYVTGTMFFDGRDKDVWLSKYDSQGNDIWTQTHNDADNMEDWGFGIALDDYGNIYVIGSEGVLGEAANIWIRKYDPDGNWAN